jgi:hypothetical protein
VRTIRTYAELVEFATFEERFRYLKLDGVVGDDTFGFDRYLNQVFYKSREWKAVRDFVIVRDGGCDLGVEGYEIFGRVLIHHMNPVSAKDIEGRNGILLEPEFLITVTHGTHNAIHYGDEGLLVKAPVERGRGDTCLWRRF